AIVKSSRRRADHDADGFSLIEGFGLCAGFGQKAQKNCETENHGKHQYPLVHDDPLSLARSRRRLSCKARRQRTKLVSSEIFLPGGATISLKVDLSRSQELAATELYGRVIPWLDCLLPHRHAASDGTKFLPKRRSGGAANQGLLFSA